jgi:FMN phosphatase YigB (HAD superfamily)
MSFSSESISSSGKYVPLRLLAALPRSGSTLFMRAFRESQGCAVTSRLVLMGNYTTGGPFKPDYSIFQSPNRHEVYQRALQGGYNTLICKEELGHEKWKGECDFALIPGPASYEMTKPAFLFRDPIRVFDSWKFVGWTDIQSLVACYTNLYNLWTSNNHTIALIYEDLIRNPRQIFQNLCLHWNVSFSEDMLSFRHPFGDFFFSSDREKRIYSDENPLGLFDTVKSHGSVVPNIKSHNLLSHKEIETIEAELGPMYLRCYGDRIESIRRTLLEKTWFGFDLDDTLHEFRKASRAASLPIFEHIAQSCDATVEDLRATYSKILSQKTSGAFTDGKSSETYRKERFSALMEAYSVRFTDTTLDQLAAVYKESLQSSLEAKPGAVSLLRYLKHIGKKIAIVTEGPEDAQEWTLEKLGIASNVDVLVTTNRFRRAKVDGLFVLVLKHLNIDAESIVYVGDSLERDISPARAEGILAVQFDEMESAFLDMTDLKINSLQKLENILRF